jgi:DNA transposition AAA+ family ATPase
MKETNKSILVDTVSYRNFVEISQACREQKEIGLTFGKPGVGKTLASRRFAQWDTVESNFNAKNGVPARAEDLMRCDVLYYLPSITVSAPRLLTELSRLRNRFDDVISRAVTWTKPDQWANEIQNRHTKLIIVDEAHRLKYQALEQLRDIQDQWEVGMILIGDPGMERSITRMWHFCDRIAKVDEFKAMEKSEVFEYIDSWALTMNLPKPTEDVHELVNWYSRGNPRALGHLFSMVARILKINDDLVTEMTREVIETAREMMLFGLNGTLAKQAQ